MGGCSPPIKKKKKRVLIGLLALYSEKYSEKKIEKNRKIDGEIGLKSKYLRFPCGWPFIAPHAVRLTGGAICRRPKWVFIKKNLRKKKWMPDSKFFTFFSQKTTFFSIFDGAGQSTAAPHRRICAARQPIRRAMEQKALRYPPPHANREVGEGVPHA